MQAGQAIFSLFHRAAVMPEPMEYRVDAVRTGPGQTQSIYDEGDSYSDPETAFSVGICDGRYVADEFDNGIGGSWDYQYWANHVGFDLEKGLAIRAIADGRATLSTISRENYLDNRLSKINFRDDMPRAVDRLMGGLLAEDWETVGTYVPATSAPGEQLSPKLIDLTGEQLCIPTAAQGRILFANVGYSQQSSMAILASLFSRQNTDMTLMHKLRVFVDGVDGPIAASGIPDAQQVRFTDPRTGYTYVARKFGEETVYDLTCTQELKKIDQGIASRMLQHANALLAVTYYVDRDGQGDPKFDAYGRPLLSLDASGSPVILDGAREAEAQQVRRAARHPAAGRRHPGRRAHGRRRQQRRGGVAGPSPLPPSPTAGGGPSRGILHRVGGLPDTPLPSGPEIASRRSPVFSLGRPRDA
ncbi:MAG: hypothetical protein QM765_40170 [Myxococcales bacterium]